MKIFERISLKGIFSDYKKTFYNYGKRELTGETSPLPQDFLIFLFFPIILSSTLVSMDIKVNLAFFDLLISSLSIFIGLLFSLLILIFDTGKKEKIELLTKIKELNNMIDDVYTEERSILKEKKNLSELKYNYLKEISFAITMAFLSIICLFLTQFSPSSLPNILPETLTAIIKCTYYKISNSICYFMLIEFLLALMLVLKRFYTLFKAEFTEINSNDSF